MEGATDRNVPAVGDSRSPRSRGRRRYAEPVAYDRSNLHANEQIVVDEHPHWIMLMWSVIWVAASIVFGIFVLVQG